MNFLDIDTKNSTNEIMNEETNFNLFESDDESDNYLIFYNSLLNNRIIFKEEEKQKGGKEKINNSDKDEKNSKVKFVVVNEKNEQIIQLTKNKRKRGRPKKGTILVKNNYKRIHDNNQSDNLLRKIQVHYLSFIVLYLNDILKSLNYECRFHQLDYTIKKNIKKEFIESLKKKTIGEIICNKISEKYTHEKVDSNQSLKKKLEENIVFKNILNQKYLKLMKIYFKSNAILNLKEYGIDKPIVLTNKVKMFNDLLTKIKNDEKHKGKIKESILQNFKSESIFSIKYKDYNELKSH
jgi:hypothetical protein